MPDDRKREGGGKNDTDPPRLRIATDLRVGSDRNNSLADRSGSNSGSSLSVGLCSPLTAALGWNSGSSSFASTVDVDAIKFASPELRESKAPLTTIAENWESSVTDRPPKSHHANNDDDSSSDSESEGFSCSESESGSNEESSSSSCSSLESDSSSDNNENYKKENILGRRRKSSERHKQQSGSDTGNKRRGRRRSGINKSPNLNRNKSPNLTTRTRSPSYHASRSPNLSSSRRSPTTTTHRSPASPSRARRRSGAVVIPGTGSRPPGQSPLAVIGRRGQSPLSQRRGGLGSQPNLASPDRESTAGRAKTTTTGATVTKGEIHSRIFKNFCSTTAAASAAGSSSTNRTSNVKDNNCDPAALLLLQNASDITSDIFKPGHESSAVVSKHQQPPPLSSPPLPELKPPDLSEPDDDDSDDSCIILDNVSKPRHLLVGAHQSAAIFDDSAGYSHKKDLIFAAYGGRSHPREPEENKEDTTSQCEDLSETSESSDSETSSSSCESSADDLLPPDVAVMDSVSPAASPPLGDMMLSPDDDDDDCSPPPPTLEPAIPPELAPAAAARPTADIGGGPSDIFQSKSSTNNEHISSSCENNTRVVECASQTIESGFAYIPSSPELGGESPPSPASQNTSTPQPPPPKLLQGVGVEPHTSRGRPRKNPPMLKPEVRSGSESSEDDRSEDLAEVKQPQHKKKKKKDKLSIFFSVAKHMQRKSSIVGSDRDDAVDDDEVNAGRIAGKTTTTVAVGGSESSDTNEAAGTSEDNASVKPELTNLGSKSKKLGNRRRRREKQRSKVQKSHKHNKALSKSAGGGHREQRSSKKSKKQRRTVLEEEKMEVDEVEEEEVEKVRRHKEKRQRKKSTRDDCFECQEFTKKSRRPSSTDGVGKRHRRPSSSASSSVPRRTASALGTARGAESSAAAHRSASADTPTDRKCDNKKSDAESHSFSRDTVAGQANFLSIFTQKPSDEMTNHFAPPDGTSQLVFPRKFCNLKVDRFWKKSRRKQIVAEEKVEPVDQAPPSAAPPPAPPPVSGKDPVFATKASVKEIPSSQYIPATQVQQMLKVLAATSSSTTSTKTKKRKEKDSSRRSEEKEGRHRREDKEDRQRGEDKESGRSRGEERESSRRRGGEDSRRGRGEENRRRGGGKAEEKTVPVPAAASSLGYDTLSEDEESLGSRRRRRQQLGGSLWKSKHKNVIDPVFLGELEHLMQDLACCQLDHKISPDLWPDRPSNSMPSIFKRRKIFVSRRKREPGRIGKKVKTPRNSGQEKARMPRASERSADGGTDEQRLPLKKRHHHHLQGTGSKNNMDEIEIEIEIGRISPVKSAATEPPEIVTLTSDESPKSRPEPTSSPRFRIEDKLSPTKSKSADDKAGSAGGRSKTGTKDILSPSKLPLARSPPDLSGLKILQENLNKPMPVDKDRLTVPERFAGERLTAVSDLLIEKSPVADNRFSTNEKQLVKDDKSKSKETDTFPDKTAIAADRLVKKQTVADRLVEKLGIHIKKEDGDHVGRQRSELMRGGRSVDVEVVEHLPRKSAESLGRGATASLYRVTGGDGGQKIPGGPRTATLWREESRAEARLKLKEQERTRQQQQQRTPKSSKAMTNSSSSTQETSQQQHRLLDLRMERSSLRVKREEFDAASSSSSSSSTVRQHHHHHHHHHHQHRLHRDEQCGGVGSFDRIRSKTTEAAGSLLVAADQHRSRSTSMKLAHDSGSSAAAAGAKHDHRRRGQSTATATLFPVDQECQPSGGGSGVGGSRRGHVQERCRPASADEAGAVARLKSGGRMQRMAGNWDRWKHRDRQEASSGSSFVDSIQDCIDKYTFVDEEETAESPFSTLPRRYLSSGGSGSKASSATRKAAESAADKSIPLFSSPEPEPLNTSGRESSLSHTSSESFPSTTPDTSSEASTMFMGSKPSTTSTTSSSYIGRASRQDLHTHLWREEKFKKSTGSGGITPNSSMMSAGAGGGNSLSDSLSFAGGSQQLDSAAAAAGSGSGHTTDITLQMSKPLPTEPIRRVDLGFSHKPLDKAMRFHRGGQECYIKKVPQAIVAPFRRNPPETASASATSSAVVTPIHRASIATAAITSMQSSTGAASVTTATTTTTAQDPAVNNTVHPAVVKDNGKESVKETDKEPDSKPNQASSKSSRDPANKKDLPEPYNLKDPVPAETPVVATAPKPATSMTESNSTTSPTVKSPPKTRSKGGKPEDVEETMEKQQAIIPDRISLSEKTNVVERMIKCQVEVCRLKDDKSKDQCSVSRHESTKKTDARRVAAESDKDARKLDDSRKPAESNNKTPPASSTLSAKLKETKKEEDRAKAKESNSKSSLRAAEDAKPAVKITLKTLTGKKEVAKPAMKKRKRRHNKTGFPTKIKKKKPRLDDLVVEVKSSARDSKPSALEQLEQQEQTNKQAADENENSEVRRILFDPVTVSSSSSSTSVSSSSSSSSGVAAVNTSNICRDLETKLKRTRDLSGRGGRLVKRFKKLGQSSTDTSNSSSIDPSPTSSDVESSSVGGGVDSRVIWVDDESDQDTLSVLPPSDESLSSSLPSPSSSSRGEKRKQHQRKGGNSTSRKTYLKAGLFSMDYKTVVNQSADPEVRMKGMVYKPEEHSFGLLPPPYYCGRQLRQKKEDFALPFDIWSLYASKAIPTRDVLATWNYKRIKHNIYYDVKPSVADSGETPSCHCKFPPAPKDKGCLDDCINRMTYTECDVSSCRLGDRCANNAIQKHASPAVVERFMTSEKGWGIRTKTAMPSGTFIMEYLGEVVTDKEFKRRMHTEYQKDSHHYCLHLGEGFVIDGHRMGGECRFVNHSCKPNCEMQKWSVNGVYRMALFSSKDLAVDEELTYDYNFSLFNPHEGQVCRCNMAECRGVIGGKSQRVKTQNKAGKASKKAEEKKKEKDLGKSVDKPSKTASVRQETATVQREVKEEAEEDAEAVVTDAVKKASSIPVLIPVKPMSVSQRDFCRAHSVLLPRNLEKIKKLREKYLSKVNQSNSVSRFKSSFESSSSSGMKKSTKSADDGQDCVDHPLAASASFVRTERRGITVGLDTLDVTQVLQLAKCFREVLASLHSIKAKTGGGESLMKLLYNKDANVAAGDLVDPIDLTVIERSLNTGLYGCVAQFDEDLLLLFQTYFRLYGNQNLAGNAALSLRTSYLATCDKFYKRLAEEISPELTVYTRRPEIKAQEDEIGCPCNQFRDEGVMIQCDTCAVWQHLDCVRPGVDPDTVDSFVCAPCAKTAPVLDIELLPQPEYACPGEVYYVSLQREDKLHVTLGMTVYVLRAFKDKEALSVETASRGENIFTGPGGIPHKSISPIKGPSKEAASLAPGNYPTYRTVDPASVSTRDMDIFRVERLWKNEAGAMFAFGYHYLRPHETFHEPTRRFFDNEVFRVPLYEVLPLDTIWRQCWVTEPATFCRGRPLAAQEEHVYICEYRVDKSARLFNKISKPKHAVCTKYYAFHTFDLRLRVNRTFTPHSVPEKWAKNTVKGRDSSLEKEKKNTMIKGRDPSLEKDRKIKEGKMKKKVKATIMDKEKRKGLLSQILPTLLLRQEDPQPLDASYLLHRSIEKPKRKDVTACDVTDNSQENHGHKKSTTSKSRRIRSPVAELTEKSRLGGGRRRVSPEGDPKEGRKRPATTATVEKRSRSKREPAREIDESREEIKDTKLRRRASPVEASAADAGQMQAGAEDPTDQTEAKIDAREKMEKAATTKRMAARNAKDGSCSNKDDVVNTDDRNKKKDEIKPESKSKEKENKALGNSPRKDKSKTKQKPESANDRETADNKQENEIERRLDANKSEAKDDNDTAADRTDKKLDKVDDNKNESYKARDAVDAAGLNSEPVESPKKQDAKTTELEEEESQTHPDDKTASDKKDDKQKADRTADGGDRSSPTELRRDKRKKPKLDVTDQAI